MLLSNKSSKIISSKEALKNVEVFFNFHEMYFIGEKTIEDINNYIDDWHNSNSNKKLHEFLGLTEKQYKNWVETGKLEVE